MDFSRIKPVHLLLVPCILLSLFSPNLQSKSSSPNSIFSFDPPFTTPMKSITPINWWNDSFTYRQPFNIENPYSYQIQNKSIIQIQLNTLQLVVDNKMNFEGRDLRIIWFDSLNSQYHNLKFKNLTSFNTTKTIIAFQIETAIEEENSVQNHFLYYGNPLAMTLTQLLEMEAEFYDDFNQTNGVVENWTGIEENWYVLEHQYHENPANLDIYQDERTSYIHDYSSQDGQVQLDVLSKGEDFGIGIVFRGINANRFLVAGLGLWNFHTAFGMGTSKSIEYIASNGRVESELLPNVWYNLAINYKDERIEIFLDSILQLNITDSSILESGIVGIFCNSESESVFDNFMIPRNDSLTLIYAFGDEETYPPINYGIQINNLEQKIETVQNITIIPADLSAVFQINIQFENRNFSLESNGQEWLWLWFDVIPIEIGISYFTIFVQYRDFSWRSYDTHLIISDEDETPPPINFEIQISNLEQEIENLQNITIIPADLSAVLQISIQLENQNYSLESIGQEWLWHWFDVLPIEIGTSHFTIFVQYSDFSWRSYDTQLNIFDSIPPTSPILTMNIVGQPGNIIEFDWEDGYDLGGIHHYLLIISTDINLANTENLLYNITILNLDGNNSHYSISGLLEGQFYFWLYQFDSGGNRSPPTMGSFIIENDLISTITNSQVNTTSSTETQVNTTTSDISPDTKKITENGSQFNYIWGSLIGIIGSTVLIQRKKIVSMVKKYQSCDVHNKLESRKTYLFVKNDISEPMHLFSQISNEFFNKVIISRQAPNNLKSEFGISCKRILWMNTSILDENQLFIPPKPELIFYMTKKILQIQSTTLKDQDLSIHPNDKINLVLFEGLEYLMNYHPFSTVCKLLESLSDQATINNGILMIIINPSIINPKELATLQKMAEVWK